MKENIEKNWDEILNILENHYDVSRIIIETWIKPLSIYDVKDNVVYLYVDEKRGKHGVDYLHNKGYELNVISNGFKGVQERKLEAGGMNRYIKHVILSEDCGITKPRPGIYDYAMQVCGAKPSSIVMIGDDPTTDIAGALNAGWRTIYFNTRSIDCSEAHHTVSSLLSIKDLL